MFVFLGEEFHAPDSDFASPRSLSAFGVDGQSPTVGGRPAGRGFTHIKPKNSPETRCPVEREPHRGSFHQIVRHGIVWRQKEGLSFRGSRLR